MLTDSDCEKIIKEDYWRRAQGPGIQSEDYVELLHRLIRLGYDRGVLDARKDIKSGRIVIHAN